MPCQVPELSNGYFLNPSTGETLDNGTIVPSFQVIEAKCQGAGFVLLPAHSAAKTFTVTFICLPNGQWDIEPSEARCQSQDSSNQMPKTNKPKKECSITKMPDVRIKYANSSEKVVFDFGEWVGFASIRNGQKIVKQCNRKVVVKGNKEATCKNGHFQPPLGTCPSEEHVRRREGVPNGTYCYLPHVKNGFYVGSDPFGNFQKFYGSHIPIGASHLRERCDGGYRLIGGFRVYDCTFDYGLVKRVDTNHQVPFCYNGHYMRASAPTTLQEFNMIPLLFICLFSLPFFHATI